jgi:hypothetical protein
VPIKSKKELEAKTVPGGSADNLYKDEKKLVGWRDNKAVNMASSVHGAAMDKTCRRNNRVEKRDMQVSRHSLNGITAKEVRR